MDGKVKTLGQGPHWLTILSAPSNPLPSTPTPLLPSVASSAAPLDPLLLTDGTPLPYVLKLVLVRLSPITLTPSVVSHQSRI